MSTKLKPIKIWGQGGPNPPKVYFILEELSLPYEVDPLSKTDVKTPEYLAINPNGRVPAIHDPNTGLTLWESGAIVEYLVETYDKNHVISFPRGSHEAHLAHQWLIFQVSGQGPYYGQVIWFIKFHPEKLPSAVERYAGEVRRVSGVLDGWLAQQEKEYANGEGDGPWLVGNKLSYADLAFVQWQRVVGLVLTKEQYDEDNFPHLKIWMAKMKSRKSVLTVLETEQAPKS